MAAAAAAAPRADAEPLSPEAVFDMAEAGDAAGLREALANGADASVKNKSGDLAIHVAAAAGHVEACVALAAHTRPMGCLSQTSKKSAYETLVDQVGEVAAKPLKDAEEAAASAPPSPWLAEFSADAAALEERIAKLEDIFQQL